MLTDGSNVLNGLQIITQYTGWFRIYQIDYVSADDYTPTYTATDNLSSISLDESGSTATVTASLSSYCDGEIGGGFSYNVTVTSSNPSVISVSGTTLKPLSVGDSTITVTYSDKNGNTLKTDSQPIHVATYAEQLAETLGENELVNWDNANYKFFVSDTTVPGRSMEKESYTPSVDTGARSYKFVPPTATNGSGRTILFPVQNTYTEGYVKIDLKAQSGNIPAYTNAITIYKVGVTSANNFALRVNGSGTNTMSIYVPVSALVDSENKLNGLQIVMTMGVWIHIKTISYSATNS
jgi:hypothetical protein